jgi:hypothetical protein
VRNILKFKLDRKFYGVLLHPFIISLIVTVIILQIFPLHISKFLVKVEQGDLGSENTIVVWEDLENDGTSDKILISNVLIGGVNLAIYPEPYPSVVKDCVIPGKMVNQYNNDCFVIGAIGKGKSKEIFVFTKSNDSLFLNRITDFSKRRMIYEQRFISKFRLVKGASDVQIVKPRLEDLDGDQVKELIFGITTGYSIIPRAMFIYDLKKDTLLRSVETGNYLGDFLITDLKGDGEKEIITMGYAPRNILDTVVTFHDSSNWAMVFDHNLRLLSKPAEFLGRTGEHLLILEITDNGVGRTTSEVSEITSTGKGMQIMKQFYDLYFKSTGTRVQSMVTDLYDEAGHASGTKVVVTISIA